MTEGIGLYVKDCNAESASELDLIGHPRRRAGSTPILGNIRLSDGDGNPADQFLCGKPVQIELEVHPTCNVSRPHFAVRVRGHAGLQGSSRWRRT